MNTFRNKALRILAALLLACSTVMMTQQALADTMPDSDVEKGAAMVGDLVFARPLGFAATVLGSVVFVISLPITLLGGNVVEAGNTLVIEPAKFTFTRPLGK